jgi:hypothetical protein
MARTSVSMQRTLLAIAALSLLLTAIDQLYRVLHPEVNLVRASLVGLTALVALAALARLRRAVPVRAGALAVFASAFLSVLLIEAGALVSRSPASALVHVLILAGAYALLERARPGHCAGVAYRTDSPTSKGSHRCSRSPYSSAAPAASPSTAGSRRRS